jgi:hypothetical protein
MRERQLQSQLRASGLRADLLRTALFFMLVCTSAPFIGQEENESGTAATIRALEREWVEGQSRNDNGALDLIFDNSLVYVEYGNLVTKGEYLSRVKSASPAASQIAMEPMTVRIFGSTAIVTGTYREKLVKSGTPDIRHWRFVDTWVYKKSVWVLVAAAAVPMQQ